MKNIEKFQQPKSLDKPFSIRLTNGKEKSFKTARELHSWWARYSQLAGFKKKKSKKGKSK